MSKSAPAASPLQGMSRLAIAAFGVVLLLCVALTIAVVKLRGKCGELEHSHNELTACRDRNARLDDQCAATGRDLEETRKTLAAKGADLAATSQRLADCTRRLAEAQDGLLGAARLREELEGRKSELEKEIDRLRSGSVLLEAENRSLDKQWKTAFAQLDGYAGSLAKHPGILEQLPLGLAVRPRAIAMPLGKGKGFHFKLWVEISVARQADVKRVVYLLNHPTIVESRRLESSDPTNSFEVQYYGPQAADRVLVMVQDARGGRHRLALDMHADLTKPQVDFDTGAEPVPPEKVPLIDKPRLEP